MQIKDNGVTERRRGLHELADQIACLRDEVHEARDLIDKRIGELEDWKHASQPIIEAVNKAIWMVGGAAVIFTFAVGIVLWVWLQDHQILVEVSKLVVIDSTKISELERADQRHEKQIERLEVNPPTGEVKWQNRQH